MVAWEVTLTRLVLAALLGGIVGFERERKDWAVGIRTHMLACVGSSLVMMVSSFGFSDILSMPNVSLDPSRVASSVIIGIGYLGAGIILILKRGNIKGLTTASALWTTAGIGLACGGGLYFMASAATVIIVGILYGMQVLQKKLSLVTERHSLRIDVASGRENAVISKVMQLPLKVADIRIKKRKRETRITATTVKHDKIRPDIILADIQAIPDVLKVGWF